MELYKILSLEDMPGEVWKDIPGHENRYRISNLGRVKSIGRPTPGKLGSIRMIRTRILRHRKDKKGYHRVALYNGNGQEHILVARLVAAAFIPNPNKKTQVDHIDNNKDNNTSSNLRWVTSHENMTNPISIERRKNTWREKFPQKEKGPDKRERKVIAVNPSTGELRKYSTMRDASSDGFNPKYVSRVCHNGCKTTNGWMFFLPDDPRLKSYLPKGCQYLSQGS